MKLEILGLIFLILTMGKELHVDEIQDMQLLNPTFENLQVEFVWSQAACYVVLADDLIEQVMDRYFHKIDFMHFAENEKEIRA